MICFFPRKLIVPASQYTTDVPLLSYCSRKHCRAREHYIPDSLSLTINNQEVAHRHEYVLPPYSTAAHAAASGTYTAAILPHGHFQRGGQGQVVVVVCSS